MLAAHMPSHVTASGRVQLLQQQLLLLLVVVVVVVLLLLRSLRDFGSINVRRCKFARALGRGVALLLVRMLMLRGRGRTHSYEAIPGRLARPI